MQYDEFNDRDWCVECCPESFVGSPCSISEDYEYAMETDSSRRPDDDPAKAVAR